jgi:predicted Zn-dependent protease
MIEPGTPIRAQQPTLASRVTCIATAAAMTVSGILVPAAQAQESAPNGGGVPIIRDAETEQLLRDYARPILKVAGLAKQNVKVVIINDTQFNAFVMDGRHIFVNAGALMDTRTPNEMIGILAHETGHLAGGHLMRMRERLAAAQTQTIVAMLLGIGAMVATARSGGGVGIGGAMAPAEAIRRSLLAYARTQEDQADHAAVKFLTETHQSAKGLIDAFKRLSNESLFATQRANPYLQTHPFPQDRVATLETIAHASPYYNAKDPPALQLRHDLVRAKLFGFLDRPDTVARRYPMTDTSLPARYARAIATYRHSNMTSALVQIDGLIQSQPNNPYFHELKGQVLLEGGKPALAVGPLRRAVQLAPDPALIEIMLAQAINASPDGPKRAEEVIRLLRSAMTQEQDTPAIYSQLAIAYARKGDLAQADLASAKAAYYRGDRKNAEMLASRAKTRFPVGSPAWIQADDIVSAKPKPN